ncbi:geranylgeranyl pyrophosphate synthase-like [Camponotus floridanus]|uniref:geranylgeranyl pyrophosphate synthase-like n=1 Tax=Camponotus floridanus TaxID=104421 RepID=UPI000DC69565|nr:geranylgeranyl pyrophosphate synthase-like [Camponotus floridanus]XP_025269370.1 geranylgeranyl pyrophosphate synthase-like [Camponotus floridanus]XP_025269371.1 geranylgeranyl pyrophosphate synthase-like [Camponotus floridanus]XP_025269372.1 geranylgeranyl pyrophosphate synthase-like [Camponotus floridanus]
MTNTNNNLFYYSLSGNKQEDDKLLEPIRYNFQIPGMQITAKLIQTFNYWLKISPDRIKAIEEIVIMLHNSVLIIDDIQDNSILRKGIPVTHSVFGIANSLNAALYIVFITVERVINLQHPAAPKVYIEQLLELHRGQGIDIFWRDNFICPSEEDYKAMAIKKIGFLFNLPIRLMNLFSTYEEDLSPLLALLSLYYQIRDDYCNLCLSDYTENNYCDDLTEGKFSFPVIHALKTNPDDTQIMNILKQRTKDIEMKRHCIKLLEKFGSLKYTRSVLEELDLKIRAEIDRLGGNPFLIKILDELKNWDSKEATQDPLTQTFL